MDGIAAALSAELADRSLSVRWTDAAQPLSSLPQLASQPGRAERLSQEHLGRSAAGVKVLPVIARVSGWSMALDGGSGEVLGFLPVD